MGAYFLAVELDNVIWFSTLSTSFLGRFLQYMLELEVLVCSLDTDVNYVTAMLQLHPSLKH